MLGIFLDMETTGLNAIKHRAIEIAIKILDLDTGIEQGVYETIIFQPKEVWDFSDPDSLAINGFVWSKVLSGKTEAEAAQQISFLFNSLQIRRGTAVFICQNPSFDRSFFSQIIDVDVQEKYKWPYHWLDFASMYWALHIREKINTQGSVGKDGLSKDEIASRFGLAPEERPHRAMNGVNHLILCYKAVVGFPQPHLINH